MEWLLENRKGRCKGWAAVASDQILKMTSMKAKFPLQYCTLSLKKFAL
jgi:hypothetical protein